MSDFQFTVTYAPVMIAVLGSIVCSALTAGIVSRMRRR